VCCCVSILLVWPYGHADRRRLCCLGCTRPRFHSRIHFVFLKTFCVHRDNDRQTDRQTRVHGVQLSWLWVGAHTYTHVYISTRDCDCEQFRTLNLYTEILLPVRERAKGKEKRKGKREKGKGGNVMGCGWHAFVTFVLESRALGRLREFTVVKRSHLSNITNKISERGAMTVEGGRERRERTDGSRRGRFRCCCSGSSWREPEAW
jgi:hypothetical protein